MGSRLRAGDMRVFYLEPCHKENFGAIGISDCNIGRQPFLLRSL